MGPGETSRRLPLDGHGRFAVLDRDGWVVLLGFPGGTRARFQPGAGVPRRIEVSSSEGRVVLTLENYLPWPPGEAVPPSGGGN